MQLNKIFWIATLFALVISIGLQAWLMQGAMDESIRRVEPPRDVVLETNSVFWTFRTREIDSLVANLRDKNIDLNKRENQVKELELRLASEKEELNKLKSKVEDSMKQLSDRLFEVDQVEQKNLKNLAATYSNISPDAVILIFSEMDDSLVVKILSYMSTDVVGPIFQAMAESQEKEGISAERVAKISELLRLSLASKKNG